MEWELKREENYVLWRFVSHLLRRCSIQLHSGGFIHTTLSRKEKLIITKEIMWKIPSWCFVFVEYEEYREQITSNKTPFDYVLWDWSLRAIRPFRGSYTLHYTLCIVWTNTHTAAVSVCVTATTRFVWPQRLKSINLIRAAFTYWTSASSSLMNPLLGSLNHLERDERTWNRFTLYWTQDTHTRTHAHTHTHTHTHSLLSDKCERLIQPQLNHWPPAESM